MSPESIKYQLEEEAEDILAEQLNACKREVEFNITKWMADHEHEEKEKYDALLEEFKDIKTQLSALLKLFEQAKGAVTVIKYLGYTVAGLWAFALWAKDHLKV